METIDLNLLSLFVAVAETASFSAAAHKLGVPKSSVSRGVSTLEEQMGVRLLHRTTRRVATSTAGAALYEKIAPELQSLKKLLGELPELETQPSGKLRVTASIDFGATVLAELVARFLARCPTVEIELHITNEIVDLVAEGYDVGLRISTRALRDSSLSARRLGQVPLQLFASPQYLARRGTPRSLRELDGHDWILFRGMSKLRLESGSEVASFKPVGRLECDDMSFARAAARAGSGIGILPTFLAEADVAAGQLVRVLPRWNIRSGSVYFVCPSAKKIPRKVAAFRDFIVEALKSQPGLSG